MDDVDENAHLVNALQRYASVVVQKSLVEGFGLTVTEPMWKARPVVASAVGGIQDQIEHGVSGLLLDDPFDLVAMLSAVDSLLRDPQTAERLGRGAHLRVLDRFLADRHLHPVRRHVRAHDRAVDEPTVSCSAPATARRAGCWP